MNRSMLSAAVWGITAPVISARFLNNIREKRRTLIARNIIYRPVRADGSPLGGNDMGNCHYTYLTSEAVTEGHPDKKKWKNCYLHQNP